MTHSKEGLLNLNRELLNEEIKGAEKCVKKCTPSFTIKECKLKGFCDFILLQSEWQLSREPRTVNPGEDLGEKGALICCWWGSELGQPLWELLWRIFKKLKINPPYKSAGLLFDLCPKDSTPHFADPCSVMFLAALFATTRPLKQDSRRGKQPTSPT